MKVLLCHNYYQRPGGEDQVFHDERWLLESHGHEVITYTRHNDDIRAMSHWDVARRTLWNRDTYRELRSKIRRERPSIVHCTNTFPLISPAAYYAARAESVPVVQSLHNFRLFCANGYFLRDGKVCEDCLSKKFAWPSVVHKCYRDSRAASCVLSTMVTAHRVMRTWDQAIDKFIALTEHSRQKFIAGGLPAEKIAVKPNFVHPRPTTGTGSGDYAVFVGRLSQEKGIRTVLDAWNSNPPNVKLKIIGDGPLADEVRSAAAENETIEFLGWQSLEEVCVILAEAKFLVMPSLWYETFGRTTIEAFATGTPVIASRLGAMAELVTEGETGLLFEPGNAADLSEKIADLLGDSKRLARMRTNARQAYEQNYTSEANYEQLMVIYHEAMAGYANQPAPQTGYVTQGLS